MPFNIGPMELLLLVFVGLVIIGIPIALLLGILSRGRDRNKRE